MDYPLRDPLMVKVGHLVQEDEVLDEHGPTWTHRLYSRLEVDGMAMTCGQHVGCLC